jgi:O-antigen/teichoic acid export membrane protein
MGIIRRQSIKATIFSYLGVAIGYVNIIWILPYCLSTEQIGLLRVLVDAATVFAALAALGMINASQKFYPHFADDDKRHKGFLLASLIIPGIGFALFTVLFFGFRDMLLQPFVKNAPMLVTYSNWLVPLTAILILLTMFETQASNYFRIAIPKLLREILIRLMTAAIVLLFFYKILSFPQLVSAQVLIYGFAAGFMIIYLFFIRKKNMEEGISMPEKSEWKEILTYCLFIIIGGIGSMIAGKIDTVMVSSMLANGLSKNGVYTTALFIATIIEIPGRAIGAIAVPVISSALKENDIPKIGGLYKNSSTIQFTVGLFLFLAIWLNVDNIFGIMPHGAEFAAGKYTILFIGIAKLFDAVTSVNMTILLNSKYYRITLLLILVLGGLTICTNLILIPKFGLTGAAMATAFSILLYQVIATSYLYFKFKILPFSISTLKALGTGLLVLAAISFIPLMVNHYLDTVLRSLLILILFGSLTWFLKTSEQINHTAVMAWHKVLSFTKKPSDGRE